MFRFAIFTCIPQFSKFLDFRVFKFPDSKVHEYLISKFQNCQIPHSYISSALQPKLDSYWSNLSKIFKVLHDKDL